MMSLIVRALRYELGMWRSLYRWIARRRPPGEPFGYAASVSMILWAFIGVSAIEIPILHLILPWPTVQQISLVLGFYGLFWMLGLLASFKAHPHTVTDEGLRIRHSFSVDFTIPWDDILTIRKRYRSVPGVRTVRCEEGVLSIVVSGQTSVDILLREPTSFRLPRGHSDPVSEVRINVDDPDALVARARILSP